ncbi:Putative uncharacterized protein [Moritella viscosa]|nr:Putative uncharacterized protein [Moritella viscosa]
MSSKMDTKQLLPVAIEKFIWVIINSFLIEEARYTFSANQSIIDALSNAKNVASASTVLISNLSNVIDAIKKENNKGNNIKLKETLPLTYLMVSCPLFFPFLATGFSTTDDREKLFSQVRQFIELGNINNELPFYLENIDGFTSEAMGLISQYPIMGHFSNIEETRKNREAVESKRLQNQIKRRNTTIKRLAEEEAKINERISDLNKTVKVSESKTEEKVTAGENKEDGQVSAIDTPTLKS